MNSGRGCSITRLRETFTGDRIAEMPLDVGLECVCYCTVYGVVRLFTLIVASVCVKRERQSRLMLLSLKETVNQDTGPARVRFRAIYCGGGAKLRRLRSKMKGSSNGKVSV